MANRIGSCVLVSVFATSSLLTGCSSSNANSGGKANDAGTGDPPNSVDAGNKNDGAPSRAAPNLPLLTPPVKAAAPVGFDGDGPQLDLGEGHFQNLDPIPSLDASDIKQRFFTLGPTSLYRILGDIDGRLLGLNGSEAPCVEQTPIEYAISAFGQTVPFYAQCYETIGEGFLQFGRKDGTTYIFVRVGAGPLAARVTPVAGTTDKYVVDAWLSVADGRTTHGSYGVIQLHANSSNKTFEMAVAGIGFGYCGAQLKSDGLNIYAEGSGDMGTTCNAKATLCASAVDLAPVEACDAGLATFDITPLGRRATTGPIGTFDASAYPGGSNNNIDLNGEDSDSVYFGPTSPTTGTGDFRASAPPGPGSDGGAQDSAMGDSGH